MHHIQRKILSLLMHAATLSYAQMRPAGVESNHFAYHLEQLVRAGLIIKVERNYSLSDEGLALADRVSHGDITVRKQPHIITTMHVVNDHGQTLLFKYNFQPYLGMIGLPQGRTHFEETIAESASRELLEKTGLRGVNLAHRGIVYVHATKQGSDVSKLVSHIFTGAVSGTPALSAADETKGQPFWGYAGDSANLECMPGFGGIQTLLAQHPDDLFFAELTTTLR